MSVLAHASSASIAERMRQIADLPHHEDARMADCGLVLLRGRIAGSGAPFNLGEATVSRAAVVLETGETGVSYILGRDLGKARTAALIDALMQRADWRDRIEAEVIAPLAEAIASMQCRRAAESAATRVDFFTLVRGED